MATTLGRFRALGSVPYEAIEVRHPMPPGEQEAFRAAFERDVAGPLGLEVGTDEYQRAYAVARRIWLSAWERDMRIRAGEMRRERQAAAEEA